LDQHRKDVLLFRQLATLREDVAIQENLADLEWRGAYERFKSLCHELNDEQIPKHVSRWRLE
jgi:hypothetical protein